MHVSQSRWRDGRGLSEVSWRLRGGFLHHGAPPPPIWTRYAGCRRRGRSGEEGDAMSLSLQVALPPPCIRSCMPAKMVANSSQGASKSHEEMYPMASRSPGPFVGCLILKRLARMSWIWLPFSLDSNRESIRGEHLLSSTLVLQIAALSNLRPCVILRHGLNIRPSSSYIGKQLHSH